ncbi:MAG TPA: BON domain-containing protein [Mycobacteriales bacterium]|nr:BON domain-containing protein [Mycobacteriales bacterium]
MTMARPLLGTDETIRAEIATRIHAYTGGRPQWRIEVTGGRVDLYGEPDCSRTAMALLMLARTVPGVTGVHMYCGQATRQP